jgi:hypothetical protein
LTETSDPDLSHQISLLEIALLMHPCCPNLSSAYRKIGSLLSNTTDLAQTLHLLTLKAAVFATAGKPEKGFSIAVRAASRAERAGLVPALLEALAALAEILNKVGEFAAAREIVEGALPQVCSPAPYPRHRDCRRGFDRKWPTNLLTYTGIRKRLTRPSSALPPPPHNQLRRNRESSAHEIRARAAEVPEAGCKMG